MATWRPKNVVSNISLASRLVVVIDFRAMGRFLFCGPEGAKNRTVDCVRVLSRILCIFIHCVYITVIVLIDDVIFVPVILYHARDSFLLFCTYLLPINDVCIMTVPLFLYISNFYVCLV